MELSLRSRVLLASALVAGLSAGAYAAWTYLFGAEAKGTGTNVDEPVVVAKAPKKGKRKAKASSAEGLADGASVSEIVALCDVPVHQIQALDERAKEQVFYTLLSLGERGLATEDAAARERAVVYFAKAVAIVPNPTEVLSAFEQTLPKPVFADVIGRIQEDVAQRVNEYFKTVLPTSARDVVVFERDAERARVPVAARDIPAGTLLWTETPDVSVPLVTAEAPSPKPSLAMSEAISASADAAAAYEKLVSLCVSSKQTLPLMLLHYLHTLILDETAGRGPSALFVHYDHLRPPALEAVPAGDAREAALVRRILRPVNPNADAFLTDDIYAMMKGTLALNVIAVGGKSQPLATADMRTRTLDACADRAALYHCAAHMVHSCVPNVSLAYDGATQTLAVSAACDIPAGARLSMRYLPFADGASSQERAAHLQRVFGVSCACPACA